MSLTIIQQILSHKNQFLFPSVFLPQCPHSRFFFCKRSFFRAKNLRRSYSSFTKASAFRTKRSFFCTKSRLSFGSSLSFEIRSIYSHFLQTKFLSHKKIIEIAWRSLHPLLPFSPSSPQKKISSRKIFCPFLSPPLLYRMILNIAKIDSFAQKKQQASQKEVFFCSK